MKQEQAAQEHEPTTKERLLQAAIEVFANKGFVSATVREICQAAGTNVAAVNYYFGDKEKLYAAVLWHVFEEYGTSKERETVLEPGLTPEERLARFIRTEVRYLYQTTSEKECSGQHFSLFLMEMAHPSPSLSTVVDRFIRPDYEQTLEILRGILGKDTPRKVLDRCCDSLWGPIMQQIFTWPIDSLLTPERTHPAENPDELAEHITTMTLGGLAALKEELDKQRNKS